MRHYEIVLMIHPDQTPEQILKIIGNYKTFVINNNGIVHRLEDWGRRQLAYTIKKLQKAYYILMNIELSVKILAALKEKIIFDSIIIRNLIINLKRPVVDISPMLKNKDDNIQDKKK